MAEPTALRRYGPHEIIALPEHRAQINPWLTRLPPSDINGAMSKMG
jgi:hypothetical protein